jgi:hypothetical protein
LGRYFFIRAAGFGVGVGSALGLMIGAFALYRWTQRPPLPWNEAAVVATFDRVQAEYTEKGQTVLFRFVFENKTDSDYSVKDPKNALTVMGRLKGQQSLVAERATGEITVDPIFLPARQRQTVYVHLKFAINPPIPANVLGETRREAIGKYLNDHAGNLDGFIVFDEARRYQIKLPKGW